jgi:hypothetical protein
MGGRRLNQTGQALRLHDLRPTIEIVPGEFVDHHTGNESLGRDAAGPVAGLVGIEGGVVSGVINLESSGVEAPDWRPRHDEHYHEA